MDVYINNWQDTGNSVSVQQYSVDITLVYNDKEHIETVLFPNILAQIPASWLKEKLQEIMIDALRKRLDI